MFIAANIYYEETVSLICRNDLDWEEQYAETKACYKENGHLNMFIRYISSSGKNGIWLLAGVRNSG